MLTDLLGNNRDWAARIEREQPGFFKQLAAQQSPEYLWIGCSDSRVPANEIVGMLPGELFVHRNVANLVLHTDLNCLSVIQFAVQILKVKHIIVCGHYGCGGVRAALSNQDYGLIGNWLRHIKDIGFHCREILDAEPDEERRINRLCELNVLQQVENVCHTSIVQKAWRRGQPLAVHGWIYSIEDGLIKDLKVDIDCVANMPAIYSLQREALSI
ncbi:carbonic anhydrase [Marinobacterium zhoushanense]|uniref:Carbonic anhydrase n=1 Tax=Marinobacterium zhoushanense TaxID=1679163 RepID=A0ABQ1KL53_9GAMM|nr:carbonate dehydratase [Marinobacterium zhoushanense]GGB99279.1 carbonic anhydrase [Marinobacterium zhoushanense]